jgi:hypothetical protein
MRRRRRVENGMPYRSMIVLLTMVAFGCDQALAAEIAVPPILAPRETSVQTGPQNCSRWTDQCVNCSRTAPGAPAVCSNIGFACQPQAIRCLDAAVAPGDPAKK